MLITERIQQLREEYKTAAEAEKELIHLEAKRLNAPCSQCNGAKVELIGDGNFCSVVCRDQFYPASRGRKTLAEIQRTLMEWAHNPKPVEIVSQPDFFDEAKAIFVDNLQK